METEFLLLQYSIFYTKLPSNIEFYKQYIQNLQVKTYDNKVCCLKIDISTIYLINHDILPIWLFWE